MALDSRIIALIISSCILILGIIHFGVGIGIVVKHRGLSDVFQQQVSLSGYNIFIGLYSMALGIIGLITIVYEYLLLKKISIVAAFLLGLLTLASFIAALAINSQSVGNIQQTLTDNMNNFINDEDAIASVNAVQTKYQCCGVNLWLDWSRINLQGSAVVVGRRRRYSSSTLTILTQAIRRKRYTYSSYNLPSSYSFYLPSSCCKNGVSSETNSLGGYCQYQGSDNLSSFYVSGCLAPVANIAISEITGIAVINTALAMLAFVFGAEIINIYGGKSDSNDENVKQSVSDQIDPGQFQGQGQLQDQGQQPDQYGQYYITNEDQNQYYKTNEDPNQYYNYDAPTNKVYL